MATVRDTNRYPVTCYAGLDVLAKVRTLKVRAWLKAFLDRSAEKDA